MIMGNGNGHANGNGGPVTDVLKWFQTHRTERVLLAAYADPPGACKTDDWGGLTSLPHSWASAAVDRLKGMQVFEQEDYDVPTDGKVVDAAWDPAGGPVVLIDTTLEELMEYDRNRNGIRMVIPKVTSFCASIEYRTPTKAVLVGGIACTVAEACEVNGLEAMSETGGCNTASEIWLPGARQFSGALRLYRDILMRHEYVGQGDRDSRVWLNTWKTRPKLSNTLLRKLFPKRDFGVNKYLEAVGGVLCPGFVQTSDSSYSPSGKAVLHAEVAWKNGHAKRRLKRRRQPSVMIEL